MSLFKCTAGSLKNGSLPDSSERGVCNFIYLFKFKYSWWWWACIGYKRFEVEDVLRKTTDEHKIHSTLKWSLCVGLKYRQTKLRLAFTIGLATGRDDVEVISVGLFSVIGVVASDCIMLGDFLNIDSGDGYDDDRKDDDDDSDDDYFIFMCTTIWSKNQLLECLKQQNGGRIVYYKH